MVGSGAVSADDEAVRGSYSRCACIAAVGVVSSSTTVVKVKFEFEGATIEVKALETFAGAIASSAFSSTVVAGGVVSSVAGIVAVVVYSGVGSVSGDGTARCSYSSEASPGGGAAGA